MQEVSHSYVFHNLPDVSQQQFIEVLIQYSESAVPSCSSK